MSCTDGGASWSAVAAPENNFWDSVAYGDGVWVAVSQTGTNRVLVSTDARALEGYAQRLAVALDVQQRVGRHLLVGLAPRLRNLEGGLALRRSAGGAEGCGGPRLDQLRRDRRMAPAGVSNPRLLT